MREYGRYLNKIDSFEFPGLSGMDKMAGYYAGTSRESADRELQDIKL